MTVAAVYRVSVQFHTGVGFTVVAIRNHHPKLANDNMGLMPSSPCRLWLALKGLNPFYLLPVAFSFQIRNPGEKLPFYFIMSWLPDMISDFYIRQFLRHNLCHVTVCVAQYYCTGSCCLMPLSSANAKQFSGVSKGSSLGFWRIYVYIIRQSWRTILLLAALPQLPNHHHPMIPERP